MDPWTKDGAPEGAGKITDLRARRSVIFPTSHPEVGDFPNLRSRWGLVPLVVGLPQRAQGVLLEGSGSGEEETADQ